jgi:lipid II:glycine glycyltransferase (peptidoglycan interpeptide bridge formation enzyme)
MREIPERDWKAWRKLSENALERFCVRVLDEVSSFREGVESAHSRYLELFRYLRERDDEIADVFNDQRRSNAYVQITAAVRTGIVTREELTVFSAETQALIDALTTMS